MVCPACGTETSAALGRCAFCHTAIAVRSAPTGVLTPPEGIGAKTIAPSPVKDSSPESASAGGPSDHTLDTTGLPATARGVRHRVGAQGGPLANGQAFGPRYRISGLLGIGGMGAVYRAWDAELSVDVALKVIRPEVTPDAFATLELERRFKNELLLARQVTHKNVVRIHDLGEIHGIKYITMPFVEGDDLATVIRREGTLGLARSLKLARQIAAGLEAAHEAAVVHRDLKPANIMVGAAGDDDQALIMDFGIARSTAGPEQGASAGIAGTLEYMAPEQTKVGVVDQRVDVYAFGLILYEMLVGRRKPSGTGTALDDMKARIETGVPNLRSISAEMPETVDHIVSTCLQIDPANRYQTSTELLAALNRIDDQGERIPEARRLTRRLVVAASVVVAVLLGGMYVVGRRAAPGPAVEHEPVPVLVADFDNRSGDPAFEGAVEQALATALEGAPYITVFKTADARAIAADLAPGKSTRITQEVGQLIARREGIKVVVGGAIDKQGAGYRLQLLATDPANNKPIATASQNVRDKAQVLTTMASMAISVREALGESKTEMAKVAAAETVTAGSLDAMRAYARGQELLTSSKFPEALEEYQRAVTLDPRFGRAYAGIAGVYANYFKQPDKVEENYQAAMKNLDRMTDREKYRTLGTYYMDVARNYDQAIENYQELVRRYPADDGGHGNLGIAYLLVGNLPGAVTEVRKSLEIYPRNSLQRYNYAMYSMYAGNFPTAITEAARVQKENPTLEYAWLPFALSKLAQDDVTASHDAYARMAGMSAFGASFAGLGEGDLDLYFGRTRDAVRVLREGLAADAKGKISDEMKARKYVALAEANLALGQRPRAADAANEAARLSRHEGTRFAAARVLLHAGQEQKALQIAADLEKMLQRQTTAYARLISGEVALEHGRLLEGIEAFRDAQKRHDSWFSRYLLGKAYVEAGPTHSAEALAELDLCVKRRGEAADVFFADMPTLRYLPPAYYWLARAQEGVGTTALARQNYDLFLKLRADADPRDPLAEDAARRVRGLP